MSEWPDDWPIAAIQKIEEAEERLAEESRRHMEQTAELVRLAEDRRVRLAEAERDATRYRWLRRGNYSIETARAILNDTPEGIDAAIDAALERTP